jgi:ribosomal protein S27E
VESCPDSAGLLLFTTYRIVVTRLCCLVADTRSKGESLAIIFGSFEKPQVEAIKSSAENTGFLKVEALRFLNSDRLSASTVRMCDAPKNESATDSRDVLAAFGLSLPAAVESTPTLPSEKKPKKRLKKKKRQRRRAQIGEFSGHFDLVGTAPYWVTTSGHRIAQYRFRCVRCGSKQVGRLTPFRAEKMKCPNCDDVRRPLTPGEVAGGFELLGRVGPVSKCGNYTIRVRCTRCGHERTSVSSRFRGGLVCRGCDVRELRTSMSSMIGESISGFVCLQIIRCVGAKPRTIVRCSGCGHIRTISLGMYRLGLRCQRCGLNDSPKRDYTGQRFGRYLCLGAEYSRPRKSGARSRLWTIVCQDCGNQRIVQRRQIETRIRCPKCDGYSRLDSPTS